MSKHTPGPWIAYEIAPDDPEWGACEIWPAENDREDEEGEVKPVATMVMGVDNARLIAAAPSMLHLLVECERVLSRLDTLRHLDPDWPILDEVRAQIAKATGADHA